MWKWLLIGIAILMVVLSKKKTESGKSITDKAIESLKSITTKAIAEGRKQSASEVFAIGKTIASSVNTIPTGSNSSVLSLPDVYVNTLEVPSISEVVTKPLSELEPILAKTQTDISPDAFNADIAKRILLTNAGKFWTVDDVGKRFIHPLNLNGFILKYDKWAGYYGISPEGIPTSYNRNECEFSRD